MRKKILLPVVIIFLMQSCNQSYNADELGVLNIILVDAPAFYQKVKIDIETVSIHNANSSAEVGWFVANRESIRNIDLLLLRNGNYAQLVLSKVPIGKYDKIKLQFGPCSITNNGTTVLFEQNNVLQNGFIQDCSFEISPTKHCELAFDIDVYKSVSKTGMLYYFNPKFRVQDVSLTGWIKGTVVNSSRNSVYAIISTTILGDTVRTINDTLFGGEFLLSGIPANTYSIMVAPFNESSYQKVVIDSVIVKPREIKNIGEVVLP